MKKDSLNKKISEYESTINEMNLYIDELEKCNEKYRLCVKDFDKEKNNILIQTSYYENINNEKSVNEGLGLQRIKSPSPSFKKSLNKANLFGEEKNQNLLSDMSNLKK